MLTCVALFHSMVGFSQHLSLIVLTQKSSAISDITAPNCVCDLNEDSR